MDTMRVRYHGSLIEWHGVEFNAEPCPCRERIAPYGTVCDGERWKLSPDDYPEDGLWHTRTDSFTVL